MRLIHRVLRSAGSRESVRMMLASLMVFFVCSENYGQQTFEFQQLGSADVLATMKVSGTPVDDVDSILSFTLRDPLDLEYMGSADLSTLILGGPGPILKDVLGLGGDGTLLAVSFDVDRRPNWLDSGSTELFFAFQSEPDDDAIFVGCCFVSRTLAEGDWVVQQLGCMPANELPGDLDGNGDVGFPDFLVLSANFGNNVESYAEGDVTCDGTVGFDDFLALSANFGQSLATDGEVQGAASVPEPSTSTLGFIAFASLALISRRRD